MFWKGIGALFWGMVVEECECMVGGFLYTYLHVAGDAHGRIWWYRMTSSLVSNE